MTMLPKLNLPDYQPRWATNANRTLKPSETEKDVGWSDDDEPPARWMNWLQNLAYEWTRRLGALCVGNLTVPDTVVSPLLENIIFHPTLIDAGLWLCTDNTDVFTSIDGRSWGGSVKALTANAQFRSRAIDSNYAMFGLTNGSIDYTSDGSGTWANDSGMTTAGQIRALVTKYPDSDFLMLGDNFGNIEIAAGGVGSAWVAPTTPPTTIGDIVAIVRVGPSAWIVADDDGNIEISTDDGDTWADTATEPSGKVACMAYNADDSVIATCGETFLGSNVPTISYSKDLGATWTDAVIVDSKSFEHFKTIYYCGGGIWFVHGDPSATARGNEAGYVSLDNAQTWRQATYINSTLQAHVDVSDIGCNGSMLVMSTNDGHCAHTLAIPGSMNG